MAEHAEYTEAAYAAEHSAAGTPSAGTPGTPSAGTPSAGTPGIRGPAGGAAPAPADGGYAAARLNLLQQTAPAGTSGQARRTELARLTDHWLTGLLGTPPPGVALVAVGGYGRGELSPRSDLDLMLLHDGSTPAREIAALADRVWYPVWDLGIALDHSVRTLAEARTTADSDLKVQLGLLDARHVAGDEALTADLRTGALAQWRSRASQRLPELRETAAERARLHGELRFLLEPDLKEARGGLRDATALRAVAASWLADAPREGLAEAHTALLDVRDTLHLATGRATDRLALHDQDQVAAALALPDADALLRRVYEAAGTLAYAADVTWREVGRVLRARSARPRLRSLLGAARGGSNPGTGARRRGAVERTPLADGVVEHDGEAVLARTARPDRDPVLLLRAAAAAAQAGLPLARPAVWRLAGAAGATAVPQRGPGHRGEPGPGTEPTREPAAGSEQPRDSGPLLPVPWPAEAREEFVRLLGAGEATVQVWEALEAEGLITRLLPDWERVRHRPQRNPVHRWTVDRHLVETAVQAAALTREVQRPDLLLVAALLHDLGKGWPGDHSVTGETIARDAAARIGFDTADAALLAKLVRHHLLLVETATRRDLDDPETIRSVADAVGDPGALELLHALTRADALATGPAAWSAWRAGLVADLVKRTAAVLAGETAEEQTEAFTPTAEAERMAVEACRTGTPSLALHTRPDVADPLEAEPAPARTTDDARDSGPEPVGVELLVAVPDRPGVLPAVAGVLALHRLAVRSADLRELPLPGGLDGSVLLLTWRVAADYGALPRASRLRADLIRALDRSLDIPARLASREAAYRRPRRRAPATPPPRVTVAPPGSSRQATVLEVRAQDAPGLLHRIGQALEDAGVTVRSAHISTLGANAVDAFYVTAADGTPLPGPAATGLARSLEAALHD